MEARGGIEPPMKGFADPYFTTWLPRQPPIQLANSCASVLRTLSTPNDTIFEYRLDHIDMRFLSPSLHNLHERLPQTGQRA